MCKKSGRGVLAAAFLCLTFAAGLFASSSTSGHYTWQLSNQQQSVGLGNSYYPVQATLDGAAFPAGTEIAAYDSVGECVGAVKWVTGGTNSITVNGYDVYCPPTGSCVVTSPGLKSGEVIRFRVWDSVNQVECTAVTDSFYAKKGGTPPINGDSTFSGGAAWSYVYYLRAFRPPTAPVLVSPTNAAVNQVLSFNLSWNASTGATSYAVQVSSNTDFSNPAFSQSGIAATSTTVTGLANSVTYYWRARATGAYGTGKWSAAWSFTTAPASPGAPALSTPTSGSVNQPSALTLNWATSAGATAYTVQVSQASNFATTVVSKSQATTSLAFTGTNGVTYYWRVNASNANPAPSAWSSVWTFGVIPPVPVVPALTTPANGATNVAFTPATLTWGTVAYASSYSVQVSIASTFASTVASQAGSAATASINGLASSTVYYWRANAANAAGSSDWSAASSFTTGLPQPGTPVLSTPASGTVLSTSSLSTTLSWTTATNATSYTVQVSSSNTFANTAFQYSGSALTVVVSSGLVGNTPYFWRANGVNATATGAWATAWTFVTPATPNTPVVPAALSFAPSTPVTVSWQASSGATSYAVQVASSSTFGTTLLQQSGITATSVSATLPGTVPLSRYYYRVNASNASGTSSWSAAVVLVSTAVSNGLAIEGKTSFSAKNGMIAYTLQKSSPVEIVFYDMLGKAAYTMNRMHAAGSYNLAFRNCHLAAGHYTVRFKAAGTEKRAGIIVTR